MLVSEISQKASCNFRALGTRDRPRLWPRLHTGWWAKVFHVPESCAPRGAVFRAVDRRILQLLGVDAWSVFVEQWHHVIRRDHILHDVLIFEQPHPLRQAFLLREAFI